MESREDIGLRFNRFTVTEIEVCFWASLSAFYLFYAYPPASQIDVQQARHHLGRALSRVVQ
jgi:hypothetical protein